jgi:hypothetical protein
MKRKQPHDYRHPGRIFRIKTTQPGGPGSAPVTTEEDIVPSVIFAWDKSKSVERYADGTFGGRDTLKLWFRLPEWGVEIKQEDIAEVTFNRLKRQYVIEGVFEPNDAGRDPWHVVCYKDVNEGPC